jgi:hypothetical protein
MLTYPLTGMVYSVQLVNDWLDEYARLCIVAYYWPYFLAGNSDAVSQWISSVSLNGVKIANICNPNK